MKKLLFLVLIAISSSLYAKPFVCKHYSCSDNSDCCGLMYCGEDDGICHWPG